MKETKIKVLLDTNIIIDILSKRLNSENSIELLKYHKKDMMDFYVVNK